MTAEKENIGKPERDSVSVSTELTMTDHIAMLERKVWSRDQLISSLQDQLAVAKGQVELLKESNENWQEGFVLASHKLDHALQDVARINFLEASTKGYGLGWILRNSTTGRGMRLHETSLPEAQPSVREAIDAAIKGDENATA